MKKRSRLIYIGIIIIGIVILACGVLLYFSMPEIIEAYTLSQRYNARMVEKNDYTKHTTPLSQNVARDVCKKFELNINDKRCLSDSVVYGPDFFNDIKAYFRELPDQEATLQTVKDKLGTYLVSCESPNNEGIYACQYDIQGDGIYPILVIFTKEGHIYRIVASTGGS